MGRKKKEEVPLVVPVVEEKVEEKGREKGGQKEFAMDLQVPVPVKKKRESKKKEVKMQAVATPSPVVVPEAMFGLVKIEAEAWARECGFVGELDVHQVAKVDYPRFGYGFSVHIKEKAGKERMATARFTSEGKRSYWSMDGKVVI